MATLARQDGGRPDVWNDGYRVRDACRAVEQRYGLRRTAPADRTAARRPSRGEIEKAARHGRPLPSRTLLRRTVQTAAAGASSEAEFFRRLRDEGVLIRRRFSERTAGEMTGYAVALPDDLNGDGRPVWYGGGKLAADLTLPKLRRRWTGADGSVRASSQFCPLDGRHLSERTRRAVLRTAVRRAADESATTSEFLDRLRGEGLLQADAARRAAAHTRQARPASHAPAPPPTGPNAQARLAMAAFPNAWAPLPQNAQSRTAPSAPTDPVRPGRRRRP